MTSIKSAFLVASMFGVPESPMFLRCLAYMLAIGYRDIHKLLVQVSVTASYVSQSLLAEARRSVSNLLRVPLYRICVDLGHHQPSEASYACGMHPGAVIEIGFGVPQAFGEVSFRARTRFQLFLCRSVIFAVLQR